MVDADKPKTQTASGIYITEQWKSLPPFGTVLAIGPDVKNRDLVGEKVLFERYGAIKIELPNEDGTHVVENNSTLRLCKESHILGVVLHGA